MHHTTASMCFGGAIPLLRLMYTYAHDSVTTH